MIPNRATPILSAGENFQPPFNPRVICKANQFTGFYRRATLAFNGLNVNIFWGNAASQGKISVLNEIIYEHISSFGFAVMDKKKMDPWSVVGLFVGLD